MDGENYSLSVTGRCPPSLNRPSASRNGFNGCRELDKGSGFPFRSVSTVSDNILACACLNNQVLALDNSVTKVWH